MDCERQAWRIIIKCLRCDTREKHVQIQWKFKAKNALPAVTIQ